MLILNLCCRPLATQPLGFLHHYHLLQWWWGMRRRSQVQFLASQGQKLLVIGLESS